MAKAMKISAGKAEEYYYHKDPIYGKAGLGSNLTWLGTGAEYLGLFGTLNHNSGLESFTNLLYGMTPDGSSRLVGHETGPKAHDKNSATDIPLTLSKSFGIVALEDPQAREAISRIFHTVAERIEDHVFGRQTVDGETSQVKGQMIAVLAEHSVSRAGDTHPHGHMVILNNVIRPDGSHSTLENYELMKAQSSIQQDLYNEVAREFKNIGYSIETSKVGNLVIPEVAGIDKETRDLFSKRHHEIKNASELKESLRERMPNASDINIDNLAQLLTKNAKDTNLTEKDVIDSHREQVSAVGKSLPVIIQEAKAMGQSATHEQHTADDYVKFAIQDEQEKESVFSSRTIINSAIRLGCGDVVRSEIEQAFNKAVQSGELIKLGRDSRGNDAFSTPRMIEIEKQIAVATVDEANKFSPLLTPEETEKAIQTFQAEKGWQVSAGQQNAIETVLQNTGRLAVVQGDAGAGKSTAFECINNALKDIPGLEVKGLGFQGKASAELERSSGIASQTVHSFLAVKKTPSAPETSRRLWVVDEASMLGSVQLGQLLERAQDQNAQIILVGDNKQISAINSGDHHGRLQQYDLAQTAHMTEIKRQKFYDKDGNQLQPERGDNLDNAVNRYAVEMAQDLKIGDFRSAFEKLEGAGQITEVPDRQERLDYVAQRYVEHDDQRDITVLTATNRDRKDAVEQIRELQKEYGQIGQRDFTATVNDPVAISGVFRRLATSYSVGNFVSLGKDIGELKAGSVLRIADIDRSNNQLVFQYADPANQFKFDYNSSEHIAEHSVSGETVNISLKQHGSSLAQFQQVETSFSDGEKIMFLKNDNTEYGKANGIKNGVQGYIQSINEQTGIATIELENGKTIEQQLEGAYLTNGQAITINKSQGISVERALVLTPAEGVGDLLNTKSGYTALTRHEKEVEVITDSKEELLVAVSRNSEKTSTLDYMNKSEMQELQDRARENRQEQEPKTELESITEKITKSAEEKENIDHHTDVMRDQSDRQHDTNSDEKSDSTGHDDEKTEPVQELELSK